MEENQKVEEISKVIAKEFMISGADSLIPSGEFDKLDEFRTYLVGKLRDLLDNQYDKLINLLYKIDVNEKKLSELFAQKNTSSMAVSLADLIIDRTLEKVKYRQMYRKGEI